MLEPIVIQMPSAAPEKLALLFHGVGSTPQSLVALGRRLAAEFPRWAVISVPSPDVCDMGSGCQWFSVRGITEANRAQRIADTMPRFIETITQLQKATAMTVARTVLVGFSQGAIMALESTGTAHPPAGQVVAIAGRFAQEPTQAPAATTLHFIHGTSDPVIDYRYTVTAAGDLTRLGAHVTADLIEALGHGINSEVLDRVVRRLNDPLGKTEFSTGS